MYYIYIEVDIQRIKSTSCPILYEHSANFTSSFIFILVKKFTVKYKN